MALSNGQSGSQPAEYSEGTIEAEKEAKEGSYILIKFSSQDELKKYKFPDSFENFLRFENHRWQSRVSELIEQEKRNKERSKSAKRVRQHNQDRKMIKNRDKLNDESLLDVIRQASEDLRDYGVSHIDYPHDFQSNQHQACYVARYTYAYAYEYKHMFKTLVNMGMPTSGIKVLSLGCGALTDAWALDSELIHVGKNINYTGVDLVKWDKKYIPHMDGPVNIIFEKKSAQEFLEKIPEIDFDVIIFPKSIGDIGIDDKLLNAINKLSKDTFFLAVSMISYENDMRDDRVLVKGLNKVIQNAGYVIEQEKTCCNKGKNEKIAIVSTWGYPHPGLPEEINHLTGKNPILYRTHENFAVIKYTRRYKHDTQCK